MPNAERIKRINQALVETNNSLARARSYSPQFQDNELIAFYKSHIIKLNNMKEGI